MPSYFTMFLVSILAILPSTLITACSSVSIKEPLILSADEKIDVEWCIISSSEMNVIDSALSAHQNKTAFDKRIRQATNEIELRFRSQVPTNQHFVYTKIPQCSDIANHTLSNSSLTLNIELSGYGNIKRKWKLLLIGSGAIEALVQGIVVTAATDNPWLGFAVAAEEMTSEYLTWNGVDWLFGETYAPVTLEGSLYYQARLIWHNSYFVTENEDELAEQDRKDKSKQLIASLHLAQEKLMANLSEYLNREILGIKPASHAQTDEFGDDW